VLAAVLGSLLPSCPLRVAPDSRVFTRPAIRPYRSKTESPLLSLRPPSENAAHRAAAAPFPTEVVCGNTGSSREVSSPSAFSPPGAAARKSDRASHARPAYAFRFSRPLGVFVRPGPAGLVSCQIRSWGSPFRALLLPCSRSPSPAPLPSCRWGAPPTCPSPRSPSRMPKHRAELTGTHNGRDIETSFAFRALLHTRVRHFGLAV
jgi:hypothetical protein